MIGKGARNKRSSCDRGFYHSRSGTTLEEVRVRLVDVHIEPAHVSVESGLELRLAVDGVLEAVVVAVVRALALGATVCNGDAFQASESDSAIKKASRCLHGPSVSSTVRSNGRPSELRQRSQPRPAVAALTG